MDTLLGNVLLAKFENAQTMFTFLFEHLRCVRKTELPVILKSLMSPERREATGLGAEMKVLHVFVQIQFVER